MNFLVLGKLVKEPVLFGVGPRLVEADEGLEIFPLAVQQAEALRHHSDPVLGQVSLPVDDELQEGRGLRAGQAV
jgi:hypothetical protein